MREEFVPSASWLWPLPSFVAFALGCSPIALPIALAPSPLLVRVKERNAGPNYQIVLFVKGKMQDNRRYWFAL